MTLLAFIMLTICCVVEGENHQKDSFQRTVDKAFERVERMLKNDSEVAAFFGPNALNALVAMKKTVRLRVSRSAGGNVAIEQIYGKDATIVNKINSEGALVRVIEFQLS